MYLLACLALFLFVLVLPLETVSAKTSPQTLGISGVRLGQNGQVTRFVLDLNQESPFQVISMADPYRLAITMPAARWEILPGSGQLDRGVVRNFRYGSFDRSSFRVVLDLKSPIQIQQAAVLPPIRVNNKNIYRLVVDMVPVAPGQFRPQRVGAYMPPENTVVSNAAVENPAPKPVPPVIAAPPAKKTIVIDAGHGGVDPGALGVKKTYEKNITLAVAQELKLAMEKTGLYNVVLTRDRDEFIKLHDRVKIARKAKADLFISLHADHHPSREVSGASVYTLSEKASDAESARLAEQENKADLIAGIDLKEDNETISNILIDLLRQETMNHSALFGHVLVEDLQKSASVTNNPLRSAGFVVLKAPDVPSVLIEMGYLSNPGDEKMLNDADYRRNLVNAVIRSVGAYFGKMAESPHGAL